MQHLSRIGRNWNVEENCLQRSKEKKWKLLMKQELLKQLLKKKIELGMVRKENATEDKILKSVFPDSSSFF